MKISPSKWLVTYDYNSNEKSETLGLLPIFKRIRVVHIRNGYIYCSCKYRTRYGIDCCHIYPVISQSKEFEESSHHDISVLWWDTYYQISCLSADNKEFDALEKAMKILQMNEMDGLPVQLKWFNHLPIDNKKCIPDDFKKDNYLYCMNYPLIKVENNELQ